MENNWAIAVGINQYELLLPSGQLKYAVQDARAIRDFLCDRAGFIPDRVLLCSDNSPVVGGLSTRPTRSNLRKLLLEETQRARGADTFLFFFSGHGMVGKDNQDYLLPCDGNPNDLEETAISIHFVTNCLRRCQSKNVTLILDMCRYEGADSDSRKSVQVGIRTIELARQQGIVTIFSCSRGEASYEIPALGQGSFTYALLEGLGNCTILRQLERYLAQRVPNLNHQYKKPTQIPLLIPEPGWKYDFPLLQDYVTHTDIAQLKEQATSAFFEDNLDLAERLWELVNQFSKNLQDRKLAVNALRQVTLRRISSPYAQPNEQDSSAKDMIPVSSDEESQTTFEQSSQKQLLHILHEEQATRAKTQKQSEKLHTSKEIDIGNHLDNTENQVKNLPDLSSKGLSSDVWLSQLSQLVRQQRVKGLSFWGLGGITSLMLLIALSRMMNTIILPTPPNPNSSVQPPGTTVVRQHTRPSPSTPVAVDYTKLENALRLQRWKDADIETRVLLRRAVGREEGEQLEDYIVNNLPCDTLRKIDQLWREYSNNRFGFSVQRDVYQNIGKPIGFQDNYGYGIHEDAWDKFASNVGWGGWNNLFLEPNQLNYSLQAPLGHLPWWAPSLVGDGFAGVYGFSLLMSRVTSCGI